MQLLVETEHSVQLLAQAVAIPEMLTKPEGTLAKQERLTVNRTKPKSQLMQ